MQVDLSLFIAVTVVILFAATLLMLFLRSRDSRSSRLPTELEGRLQQLEKLTRDIEQLNRAFSVPKTRGGMGERLLEDLLRAWLPPQYISLQHGFSSGARVDAAVRVGSRLVSIDAKFPYESLMPLLYGEEGREGLSGEMRKVFQRYVEDIAAKYIRPEEGTFHFALLYIPSENLYYRAFIEEKSELMEYALKRSVVPVSPGSLFVYLQTISIGLKGFSLTDKQRELLDSLYALQRDFRSFAKSYSLAGTHLRNAARSFDDSLSRFGRLESAVERTLEIDPDDRD